MRFMSYSVNDTPGLALDLDGTFYGLTTNDAAYPGDLLALLRAGGNALSDAAVALQAGAIVNVDAITVQPPLRDPEKIVCVGLNYRDHSAESGFEQPDYPTLFGRFNSSLIADRAPIIRPAVSEQLDYEGELAAIIGTDAHNVSEADALAHVAGYSVFNDASIRDYQFKSPQWTAGKNFDNTGAFGPTFVTADALPAGCVGLRLQTRLNGEVMQDAIIDDMVFSVAQTISICSQFMTLRAGDVIVTGTPAGVGLGRDPKVFMKEGDVCEVEIDQVGLLRNPVKDG